MRNKPRSRRLKAARAEIGPRQLERLEDRCVLAPLIQFGTTVEPLFGSGTFSPLGFVSLRLLSTQTGRIEADPTGAFGGDVFVVSRGTNVGSGGLDPTAQGDLPGQIYRVDPYAGSGFGLGIGSPANNRRLFATVPGNGGSLGFGGYENWYDIAFDATGNFNSVTGQPTVFVSTSDAPTTGQPINPRNAIYAFRADGSSVLTSGGLPAPFAFAGSDNNQSGLLDNHPTVLAIAPNDSFGDALYSLDSRCDNPPGVDCTDGDGNVIYQVSASALNTPLPVALDTAPSLLNDHVEDVIPLLPLAPAQNNDLDPRAVVFDPNRGIILSGQFGEPAFQLYGGMFVASSDVELTDTGLSRIVQFPALNFPPLDVTPPLSVRARVIGDMTFDPVGYFGGGLFFTDYVARSLNRLNIDPVTGASVITPVANNFNVLIPTQFAATDPPGITPQQAYLDAFSVTFSADGEIMFVSDRDGIWAFYADTLANTAAGTAIGLTDVRELHAPYTGRGLGAAIIDSGVDGSHLGFQGTVAAGFNPFFPGTGNIDTDGHGTAVAGIVHQIAPDAIIVPINTLGFTFTNQDLYNSVRYIRDNPFVDDPRTFEVEQIPIVSVNMSLGIRSATDSDNNLDSDRQAFDVDRSITIPLKSIFQDYRSVHGLGIVPVGSAGNEGGLFNGMDGSIIPAVLNEVIDVVASYPFGPTPPLNGPPLTLGGTLRCTPDATAFGTDTLAYTGKINAFSSRNQVSDFAAPGTCVSTYAVSLLGPQAGPGAVGTALPLAPIAPNFNGTSASSPIVAGHFVFGFDVVAQWTAVAARGGVIAANDPALADLHQYLVRDLSSAPGSDINLAIGGALPDFASYLNPDGINAILQWTAIPREDVNIGASITTPTGTEDDVEQQRLLNSTRYRTYSHLNMANFISAVEGSVALRYFQANPAQLALLDASGGSAGVITINDIDRFVADNTRDASARAMARLLGGGDRIARVNRLAFLDIVQDERQNGGIVVSQIGTLISRLLPGNRDFVITDRHSSANRAYALDSTALRNYHDLNFLSRSTMLSPSFPAEFRNFSPADFSFGSRGASRLSFATLGRSPDAPVLFRPQIYRRTGEAGSNPMMRHGSGITLLDQSIRVEPGSNDLAAVSDDGAEFVYRRDAGGRVIEYERENDGAWTRSDVNLVSGSRHLIQSDVVAIDLQGAGNRAVFGIDGDGHVIEHVFRGPSITVSDITALVPNGLVVGGLAGYRVSLNGLDSIRLFGVNSDGELIEFRGTGGIWTVRNVSLSSNGPRLRATVSAVGGMAPAGGELAFAYALSQDGQVIEHLRKDDRWVARNLSARTGAPALQGGLAGDVHRGPNGRVRQVVGLDARGNVIRFHKEGRGGWQVETVNIESDGPRLRGELGIVYDANADSTLLYGHDRRDRLVEYTLSHDAWRWQRDNDLLDSNRNGDVAVSRDHRVAYSEMVDGALAEYWFGASEWNSRRIERDQSTLAGLDGSTESSRLVDLALTSL